MENSKAIIKLLNDIDVRLKRIEKSNGKKLLTRQETEEYLGISRTQLYHYTYPKQGNLRLKCVKRGRNRFYWLKDIHDFIKTIGDLDQEVS